MKKLAIILFMVLMCPTICFGADPSFVDYVTAVNQTYPINTVTFTYPGVVSGNLLVVEVSKSSADTCTVSSSGDTWSHDVHDFNIYLISLDIWSLPNASAGDKTIDVSCDGDANSIRVVAQQWSGMAKTNHVLDYSSDKSGYAINTTINPGSVTTSVNNAVLLSFGRTNSGLRGWVADPEYVMVNQCTVVLEPDQKLCTQKRGPVPAGTYTGNFTINADYWVGALVAYASENAETPPSAQGCTISGGTFK